MLTIYNFSFHKSPQKGYDRQKKKSKTTISPLLTFNLKVGFTFSVLSPRHVSMHTMSTHWKHAEGMSLRYGVIVLGSLMRFFLPRIYFIISVFSLCNGERFLSLRQSGRLS